MHNQLRQIRLNEGFSDEAFDHHIPYFGAVISKDVTFIDTDMPEQFDVISAAAPDMRKGSDESIYIQQFGENAIIAQHQILENKIKAIFDSAISENIENLVLGAFGCGCFLNSTQEVAGIFSNLLNLEPYKGKFHHITFAITEESKLNIFRDVFSPMIDPVST